jgi:hypothetical protein
MMFSLEVDEYKFNNKCSFSVFLLTEINAEIEFSAIFEFCFSFFSSEDKSEEEVEGKVADVDWEYTNRMD